MILVGVVVIVTVIVIVTGEIKSNPTLKASRNMFSYIRKPIKLNKACFFSSIWMASLVGLGKWVEIVSFF